MSRETYNKRILGEALYAKVASSHILLVGAGGIGCELLKDLVLSGFQSIEVVDLDTIDISNLNRQFLFQKKHVKKSKAHIARESALKFNPSVTIKSHQANIKEPQFNVEWFRRFTMVLNALDNLDARRHVNAMCLAADVPLIESGTTGYLAQAYAIKKDITECFDCYPKPTPTTYPVCTIRSTPSSPIHCIVWAKSYLFSQLFGNAEEDETMQEDASEENAHELAALARETKELNDIKASMGTEDYPRKVFAKVFTSDIERLLTMEDMWKYRTAPQPLNYDTLRQQAAAAQNSKEENNIALVDQKVWSLMECFEIFKQSVVRLSKRLQAEQAGNPEAILSFDKDDEDAMDFVTATANLRAMIFSIPQKSRFEVKSMAGNIIPAIATTNAIISGVVVMKAFAVLRGEIATMKRTYLTTVSRRPQLLILEEPSKPNPSCGVCRAASATVQVDLALAKLSDLMEKVIMASAEKGGAGLTEDVAIMDGNRMIYDIDLEDNLEMKLAELGVKDGTILRVSPDEGGDVDLAIQAMDKTETHRDEVVILSSPIPKLADNRATSLKREASPDTAPPPKKARYDTDEVVEVNDQEENGVILLD